MIDSETRFPADPIAVRANIWVRIVVLAWAALILAFVATSVPGAVTIALAVVLVGCTIAAFPHALLKAASGQEPLLTLERDGLTYRLYSDHRVSWADIAEVVLEVISEEQPDKTRPARRKLGQDRLKITIKRDARSLWPRPIIVRPAFLAVDLETLVAVIERHSGREVVRIQRSMPPSVP